MLQLPLGTVRWSLGTVLHPEDWQLSDCLHWAVALHLQRLMSVRVERKGGQGQGRRVQVPVAYFPGQKTFAPFQLGCCPVQAPIVQAPTVLLASHLAALAS